MNERGEKENQRLGVLSTIGIHGAMLALFFFAMGWRAPNPPLSDMGSGIELNFGLDDQGSGDVQPLVPVGQEEATQPKTVQEDVKQDQQKPTEEVKPEVTKADEKLTSDEKENPEIEKAKKKEVKPVKDVAVKPVDTKTKENVAETKKDDKKTVKQTDTKVAGDEKKGTPGNQGDDPNKTGDKGNPKGKLDAKALYGNPGNGGPGDGGGGGGGITVSGFDGFERPNISKPEIPSESYGTYIFAVKVNKQGEIISIRTTRRGSSLEAERIFKETIQATEFVAKVTLLQDQEGVITFNVVPPPTK